MDIMVDPGRVGSRVAPVDETEDGIDPVGTPGQADESDEPGDSGESES
ncbi:hypothetical protein J5Y04_26020 [Kitasatospora sp. RG8]|nr:hypothetical protein [Kitasatospora sp. RG8]MBP0452976.1 hypothetical protein [Kitasatospora sp. RG8]